jgi:hypothetical protein
LRNSYSVGLFLDPTLHGYCSPVRPLCRQIGISPEVHEVLGERELRKTLIEEYFKTANRWLPIIRRPKILVSVLDPSEHVNAEVVALLLAMKLVLSWPGEKGADSRLYTLTRETLLALELAGSFSLTYLQSFVLVAMYEMGHAMFPNALTSTSACARYANALGIAGTMAVQGSHWMELEERNRIWWAILILDRMTNVPMGGRQLCTPDPGNDTFLPVDEESWDNGIFPIDHPQTLFSTPSLKNGRYARLAQAVNLLSTAFLHISSPDSGVRLDLDSITQLERTLIALVHLAAVEEEERSICCLSSMAVCYR